MFDGKLQVYSEIGVLKKVMLHRPGMEIENLTPELMNRLLFDDIPYLRVAQEEHDAFADVFRTCGVEVVYLETLMAEVLQDKATRAIFMDEFIAEAGIVSPYRVAMVKAYYEAFEDAEALVKALMTGIRRERITFGLTHSLADLIETQYPFIIDPMPNLYFTRDPYAVIGNGVSLNKMRTLTRRRETIFAKYIFEHHPAVKQHQVPLWYDREDPYAIEGGDELILSDKVIAIGVSQRTDAAAVDLIAKRIFHAGQPFETILAFDIPKTRAFMHLDTVFTMVDYDTFTIHPEIEGPLTVYSIQRGDHPGEYIIEKEHMELEAILMKYLQLDKVKLIRCGGKPGIDAGREQWNDGSNTLAIAPGEVIVYARNHVTNRLLEAAGIKLHVIQSSELSRGRGGPRCMSMPLYRDQL
ncbi:arginine deiminase [Fusibacter paucivorans]|uniref:Arginine deiminase n=1 Tax=Fusibacter paucivorans TaxID=76009 RepID=A0ABS5PSA0_9FIRM|nr:arginine deiminase [Fusibacter paucivorans]MBS7527284.1 arginine deiminase [Fusibacter paucivorans]